MDSQWEKREIKRRQRKKVPYNSQLFVGFSVSGKEG